MRIKIQFILIIVTLLFQRAVGQNGQTIFFEKTDITISAVDEYAAGVEILSDTILGPNISNLKFDAEIELKSTSSKSNKILLIYSADEIDSGKNVAYKGIELITDKIDSIKPFKLGIDGRFNQVNNGKVRIKLYLWNQSHGDFFLQKLSIKLSSQPIPTLEYSIPTNFSVSQNLLFGLALILFLLFSAAHFGIWKVSEKLHVYFLLASALVIYVSAIFLTAYANIWDERVHLLVAKNAAQHGFMPVLYVNPVLNLPYDSWVECTVWLHKQPFFIWMMALSAKVFGPHLWAFRLPSALFMCLTVVAIYDISKSYLDKIGSFFAVLFALTSSYFIQLVSGRIGMEHNDIAFISLITFSFWAFHKYISTSRFKFVLLIGLFCGLAVLTKWLVGLLVFSAWGIYLLSSRQLNKQRIIHLAIAIGVCFLIFIPWQLFIFAKYPLLAAKEMALNALHFTDVVEDHSGNSWFHLNILAELFGKLLPFIFLPAMFSLFKRLKAHSTPLALSFIGMTAVLHLFFSIAATKMANFTLPAFAIICLAFGAFIADLINKTSSGAYQL